MFFKKSNEKRPASQSVFLSVTISAWRTAPAFRKWCAAAHETYDHWACPDTLHTAFEYTGSHEISV